jgi:hypothetical protein
MRCAVLCLAGLAGLVACGSSRGAAPGEDASPPADGGSGDDAPDADEEADVAHLPIWSTIAPNVDGDILAIWGSGSDDVFVGTDKASIAELRGGGLISWVVPGQGAIVAAGWGSAAEGAYATGDSAWLEQQGNHAQGGLFRYSGASVWDQVDSGTFYAVWGSSREDVYAVGPAGVSHSKGGGAFVGEKSAGTDVMSVWGSSATDVYVTTTGPMGAILHCAGDGDWLPVYPQAAEAPWLLWGSGKGDVYAVVSVGSATAPDARVVHSKADGHWMTEQVGSAATTFVAIGGNGADDVYVGGWEDDTLGRRGVLYHSAGDGQWSEVALPGSPYQVTSIWGGGAGAVYIGGFDKADGPTVLHAQR